MLNHEYNHIGPFPRVSRGYGRFSPADLIMFFRNLIAMVTGNPAFPTPSPTLAVFTAAVDDLDTTTQSAMNGGRVELAARRASQAAALSLARQLGNYVESNCDGSLETLLSSGFDAIKAPTPKVVPGIPGDPRLGYNGTSGQLLFRCKGSSNVRNFSVQRAENADGPWTDQPLSTKSSVVFEGLTPGTKYWARARANGSAGSSDWCAPTCRMAI